MHLKLPLLTCTLPLALSLPSKSQSDPELPVRSLVKDTVNTIELSQFSFEDWDISQVCIDCARPTGNSLYGCDFKFHWKDPNFNQSTVCKNSWNWDGITMDHGPSNDYNLDNFVCEAKLPEYWQFKFEKLTGFWNFNLTVSRKCRDLKDFGPRYLPQFFSYPFFDLSLISHSENRIVYAQTGSVMAKIVGMSL